MENVTSYKAHVGNVSHGLILRVMQLAYICRKGLGAQETDIMMQFLIESLVLSFFGGIIGILLGLGVSKIIAGFIKLPTVLSWQMIALAFTFSAGVGVCFGLYPARKAALHDPIDALRYE